MYKVEPVTTSKDFFKTVFFRQKCTNEISIDSVFDEDYESAIVFVKICTWSRPVTVPY